jgi:hypothetical protein
MASRPKETDVETIKCARIVDRFAAAATRRDAVKQLGALALVGAAVAVDQSTFAKGKHPPKFDRVDNACLKRCERHRNHNRCHQRCRRNRATV